MYSEYSESPRQTPASARRLGRAALCLASCLLPAAAPAELFLCIDYGRISVRSQPYGSCTRVLVTPQRDARQQHTDSTPPQHAGVLREVQGRLHSLGYRPGPADGIAGPRTRHAIRAFQRDRGLAVTGRADRALLDALRRLSSP